MRLGGPGQQHFASRWRSRGNRRPTRRGAGPAPTRLATPLNPGFQSALFTATQKGNAAPGVASAAPCDGSSSAGTVSNSKEPSTASVAVAALVLEVPPAQLSLDSSSVPAVVNNVVAVPPGVAARASASGVAAAAADASIVAGGEDAERTLPTSAKPFTLSSSVALANGRLDVVHWRGERMLRIWTPPGYSLSDAAREPYPVLYLNDGQNLFGDKPTLSGHAWHAAEAAAGLIGSGALPPFVIVGIDHAGETRPYDYLPYPPGTAGGYRLDAQEWPGGGVDAYLRAVVDEILPYAERSYGVSPDPSLRGFGGSSFGGICALCCALRHPGVFGSLLVESPSLWFADERLLREDLPRFQGPWPDRVFLAMGTQEYSGIRQLKAPEFDAKLVSYTHELAGLLESKGLARDARLAVVVEEAASHTESAWAGRLPTAMTFMGRQWWRQVMARRKDHLYFTSPRKLHAGQPAVLFFNQAKSTLLAGRPRESIKIAYGFNVDWSVGGGRADMVPAAGLEALQQEEEEVRRRRSRSGAAAATTTATPAAAGVKAEGPQASSSSSSSSSSTAPGAAASHLPAAAATAANDGGAVAEHGDDSSGFDGFDVKSCSSWLQVAFTVPPEAYEMHLAFHDGPGGNWDNNAGANFYIRVKMDMTDAQRSHNVEQALREGPAWGDVQEIAHKRAGSTYFTTPEVLVAGEPAVLYINRRRTRGLESNPNLRAHFGFNSWQLGGQEACLKPTSLWRGEHIDWWSTTLTIPSEATDLSFVLTDGHGVWDNNYGNNYVSPVKKARAAASDVGNRVLPREVQSVESMPHAAGTLHILTLTKRQGTNAAQRANKWTEEKRIRVWTPPGFDTARPPPGGYPVLFMQDGQNMFEDWLAHQGVSWRVGYTASDLITRGELPPFLVVAVDSAGAMRSLNYLPYPPGTGAGGFRGDAERWPGGGLEAYMSRLVEEVMPLVQQRFGASSDPAKVAFGGGSFAGVAALYAAMHYPHVFGCVLAESPSLWIAEGRFLQDMRLHRGMLPERLFLGCGTREYSATRDHDRDDVDVLLLSYCQEAAAILESQGMRGGRLRFLVEEGAGHHELAWQWRLTGAMRFLFGAWWDE